MLLLILFCLVLTAIVACAMCGWINAPDGDRFERGLAGVAVAVVLLVGWIVVINHATTEHNRHHRDELHESDLSLHDFSASRRALMEMESRPCPLTDGTPGSHLTHPGAMVGDGCWYTSPARERAELEARIVEAKAQADQIAKNAQAEADYIKDLEAKRDAIPAS